MCTRRKRSTSEAEEDQRSRRDDVALNGSMFAAAMLRQLKKMRAEIAGQNAPKNKSGFRAVIL
jgi:hypothetical protein